MWLAVFMAIVPLLAIPVTLIKTIVVVTAIIMAGITYSLIHRPDSTPPEQPRLRASGKDDSKPTPQRTSTESVTPASKPKPDTDSAKKSEELTEEDIKKQFFRTGTKDEQDSRASKKKADAPKHNVTDPNSDRFIAVNTYKNRIRRLGKESQ
jgi:hypothetical protein